jgi:hypothetical protein
MSRQDVSTAWRRAAAAGIFTALLTGGASLVAAEPPASSPTVQAEQATAAGAGEIQERGLPKGTQGQGKKGPEGLPANLCSSAPQVLRCQCFNQTDCKVLTALCPEACPSGSPSCACSPQIPGFTPPPHLCGMPIVSTQCSCSNAADCKILSSICPRGACPVGSQSCRCTPR